MKETQKDSNKKTISNPKEQQNKDIFTKAPATKKFRNKSVNKYKVSINPNLKRNLLNNNINYLGNMGIDLEVQELITNQAQNQNNYIQNQNNYIHTRKRTKTMKLKNQINIKPELISNKNVNQIINHNVHRHNFGQEVYDVSFENYGCMFDERFINNYCSNFSSNLDKDVFKYLMNIVKENKFESVGKKHPSTKENVLKNLKKFDLNEMYCKKQDNGYEYPNCCICINNIILKQKAVLLPCGHLLHWKCGQMWLKKNNICPLCKFELPGEKIK